MSVSLNLVAAIADFHLSCFDKYTYCCQIHVVRGALGTLRAMAKSFDFHHAPGHLIRRAHQLAVAIFMEETCDFDVTPVQFAMLNALIDKPGEDQVTLSATVAFDAATSGSVIGRLEAKGWIRREPDAQDKRRKLLWVTADGEKAARQMKRCVSKAQARILGTLDAAESAQLVALLGKLVAGHEQDA
jgi:DNA-binding MarR family transcriptional regulator